MTAANIRFFHFISLLAFAHTSSNILHVVRRTVLLISLIIGFYPFQHPLFGAIFEQELHAMSLRPGKSRRTISAQDLQLKSERTLLTPKKSAAKISKAYPEHDVNENMKENICLPSNRDTVNDQVHSSKLEPIHSPTLSKLREGDTEDTQGVMPKRGDSKITAKQRELVRKHQEAKSNLEKCPGIGGGVTMWPAMDDMRLSKRETLRLLMLSAFIIVGCTVVFFYLHGMHDGPHCMHTG